MKIFENREFASDFMKGRLFMNTIGGFKGHRDEAGELRGDDYEGVVALFQSDDVNVRVSDIKIPSKDIAAPIVIHSNELLRKNAFCIYSLNSQGHESVSSETLGELKSAFQIHESCFGLGSYCVVVRDAAAFNQRVETAIRSLGYGGSLRLVDYFDEKTFSGYFPQEKWGYHKRSFFKLQREFRVVVDTGLECPAPMFLDVGDLSDISLMTTPEEFNAGLQLQLPDGSIA